MAQMPYIGAIDAGIHQEMRRDANVLYFGQNLATTENHAFVAAYGPNRVRVTPISETAEIGIAVGAAMAGFRPVVELYMAEFMLVAMDQVVNEAPRFRYMTGGQVRSRWYSRPVMDLPLDGRANTQARSPLCSWGSRDSRWWCPPRPLMQRD